ncbi:MAG: tripartite tricarboxylate transporter substrate binding protein [Gammaproteobacteria bacterium]|nr:tripartite tricarboxylate transporter substrate binding protein [Gammaproteobacteria bacterium]MBU2286999.1 tripartite tricarboxylate transporter substrate binding protein [Gammaproteobacteria bacterium]
MNRRDSLTAIAALATSWGASSAFAQDYPSKQIRIISPYGAGGGNDTISRLLANRLGVLFNQRVIVENKPGGNTIIGNETVAKAAPDGHTLILNGNGFVTNPSFYAKIPFDPVKDFAPVAFVAFTQLVLVANPAVPANNVRELIALAKAKAGALNFGNTGQGGPEHLASVMFGQMAGAEVGTIPYKGAAPAITDLIGGQIQLMITAMAAVQPYIQNGQLKLIAMANNARSPQYPKVPTIAEALPGFDTSLWYGMMAPAGTPELIVRKLNQAINQILAEKEVLDTFTARGLFPGKPEVVGTPELFGAFIQSEIASTTRIARAAGIKPE